MFPPWKIIPPQVQSPLNDVDSEGVIVFERYAIRGLWPALNDRNSAFLIQKPPRETRFALSSLCFYSFNHCPMLFSTKRRIFPPRTKDSPECADINQKSYTEVVESDANCSAL